MTALTTAQIREAGLDECIRALLRVHDHTENADVRAKLRGLWRELDTLHGMARADLRTKANHAANRPDDTRS